MHVCHTYEGDSNAAVEQPPIAIRASAPNTHQLQNTTQRYLPVQPDKPHARLAAHIAPHDKRGPKCQANIFYLKARRRGGPAASSLLQPPSPKYELHFNYIVDNAKGMKDNSSNKRHEG
jgi:hypothetical protein